MTEQYTPAQFNKAFKGKRGRGRLGGHTPGQMNKTEAEHARTLEKLCIKGEIVWWKFEAVTFRIGHDCRYTPDFIWMSPTGEITFDDTKGGFIDPNGLTKIKVAAGLFPFRFRIVQKKAKKHGGGWDIKEIA